MQLPLVPLANNCSRDVKPANVLYNYNKDRTPTIECYITDFGITTTRGNTQKTAHEYFLAGTRGYMVLFMLVLVTSYLQRTRQCLKILE